MYLHVAIDGCLVAHTSQPGSETFVFHEYDHWTLLTVAIAHTTDEPASVTLQSLDSRDELDRVLKQSGKALDRPALGPTGRTLTVLRASEQG
ncbi:MAG TPA: hypothetical protein VK611_14265 [Acidimicrobiales bacterium]|nr:hypothetical protein [Acidimicrobiales bacterium]